MAGSSLFAAGDVQIGADDDVPVLCSRPNVTALGEWGTGTWVEGLNVLPAVDVDTRDVPYQHRPGMRPGSDIARTRKVEFTVVITRPTAAALKLELDRLMRHFRPVLLDPWAWYSTSGIPRMENQLAFRTPAGSYVMFGRYRGVRADDMRWLARNRLALKVRFEATDPVIYETTTTAVTITKNETNIPHPVAFNAGGWPAWPGGATTQIAPGGDAPARWTLTILGRSVNPMVWFIQLPPAGGVPTKISFIGVGHGSPFNFVQSAGSANAITFDAGQRSAIMLSSYLDDQLSVGAGWPELWPIAGLAFSPNGSQAPGDTSTSSATITYRRGWWAVA